MANAVTMLPTIELQIYWMKISLYFKTPFAIMSAAAAVIPCSDVFATLKPFWLRCRFTWQLLLFVERMGIS